MPIVVSMEKTKRRLKLSNEELEQKVLSRTSELESLNEQLRQDIDRRKKAEEELQKISSELEVRIKERTSELERTNELLESEIMERKRMEKALLNAAQQWRTTFDSITDMVSLLDFEGRILRCNMAMKNFVGRSFNEIINHSYWEIILGSSTSIENCPFTRMKETLRRETSEIFINGRWFNISIDPIMDESNHLTGAVNIISDITEHKQAEEAMRRSEEKYRTILHNIEEGYYEVDLEGNFIFGNDPEARTLGYSREELIGMNYRNYTDLETSKKVYEVFNQVFTAGNSVKAFCFDVIRRDGTKRFIEVSVSLIKDSEGKPTGFRGIARDITERKQAEAKRMALQEQLQQSQKMEAIGQLAGGVAHDFNNLLTIITGYSDLILGQIDEKDPLRSDIEEIKRSAERAESLTRQLLAFSRKQILQPKILNLNTVVSGMEKMLRRMIGEDIELITQLRQDLWEIKTDPGQIEQVILNLAVNARDAMPKGGKLTIETSNIEVDKEDVHSHADTIPGQYVMLSLSDTGIGMTREVREKIFEPFFTTKEKGKGTGLGLSTVYGIVKQSGGNILVYSELGKGTTFKIYLPRAEEEEKFIEREVILPRSLQGSETILIVEDEEKVRGVIHSILRKNGYSIIEASNAEEAFRLAQQGSNHPIHLLLADVVMPGINGKELADRLRLQCPEMKVIFMSGYTDRTIIEEDILKKGIPYIQKPFTSNGLANKVREVLDGG